MEIIKEELTPQAIQGVHTIIKRKRTKRHRLLLPLSAPSPTSTSSTAFSGSTTDEEEDMANCLILLAQGRTTTAMPNPEVDGSCSRVEKFTSRRFAETATTTTTTGKAGIYVYECKTCNKCFPSFQALGGHRASHKKPKLVAPVTSISEDDLELSMNSLSRPVSVITAKTRKVRRHECSICGSEFSSGQALGGHMRRHRPVESPEAKKERSLLSLDLNLPAPSEEERGGELAAGFQFVFSASAMVDCHY